MSIGISLDKQQLSWVPALVVEVGGDTELERFLQPTSHHSVVVYSPEWLDGGGEDSVFGTNLCSLCVC